MRAFLSASATAATLVGLLARRPVSYNVAIDVDRRAFLAPELADHRDTDRKSVAFVSGKIATMGTGP